MNDIGRRGGCTVLWPLLFFFLIALIWPAMAQPPQYGPHHGPPPVYYGAGVWGPGQGAPQHQGYGPPRHWNQPMTQPSESGRMYQGRWYPKGGPCWSFVPVLGWYWTCPNW